MLSDAKSCCCHQLSQTARLVYHLPDRRNVCVSQFSRCHPRGFVEFIVVTFNKFGQDDYMPVRVFVGKIFVQFIALCSISSFDNRTIYIRISAHLKLNSLALEQFLRWIVQKCFPLTAYTYNGRLHSCFEYLVSCKIESEC